MVTSTAILALEIWNTTIYRKQNVYILVLQYNAIR